MALKRSTTLLGYSSFIISIQVGTASYSVGRKFEIPDLYSLMFALHSQELIFRTFGLVRA